MPKRHTNADVIIAKTRDDKNDYYLSIAKAFSYGSPCPPGKQHGCVAVRGKRVISSGYNGPSTGEPHCGLECPLEQHKRITGVKRFDLCPAVHAEVNVICTAAMHGISLEGSVLYITKRPCDACLRILINMQLGAVVFYCDNETDQGILLGPTLRKEMYLASK